MAVLLVCVLAGGLLAICVSNKQRRECRERIADTCLVAHGSECALSAVRICDGSPGP